jgi:hypothetical protein
MKTALYTAVALATIPTSIFAQQTENSNEKPVKLEINIPINEQSQRNLILVPMVTIDGHLLRFYDQIDSDVIIEIAQKVGNNENPVIVYNATKSSEESQHELPESLTGEYLIYITIDNTLYYGEITVE